MNKRKTGKFSKSSARKVLFVCNGNVFRSFSAECLLKHYLYRHKIEGWEVFSAGITAKKEKVDPEVITELKMFGIKDFRHRQHRLNRSMLKKFNLVIAVAKDQIYFMKKKFNYTHAILFDELIKDKESSIWDIEDDVKNYKTDRRGVKKKIDNTVEYIHDNIPKLVRNINLRVYLFSDFVSGLRKHANGFPFIKLYETQNTLAFMSIKIPTKEDGHIIVIPKKRFIYFHEIPQNILKELLQVIQKIGMVLDRDHGGYNVLLNNGRAAGQYFFHAHFHIIPRDYNDKINIENWTSKKMTSWQFVEFNKKLKKKILTTK